MLLHNPQYKTQSSRKPSLTRHLPHTHLSRLIPHPCLLSCNISTPHHPDSQLWEGANSLHSWAAGFLSRLQVWNSLPSFPPTTLPGQIWAILWVSQTLLPMGSLPLNHVPNALCASTLHKSGITSVLLTTVSPTMGNQHNQQSNVLTGKWKQRLSQ